MTLDLPRQNCVNTFSDSFLSTRTVRVRKEGIVENFVVNLHTGCRIGQ